MQFQVMAKPSGASCNLRCSYCFYTEKENLYQTPAQVQMSQEVLESFLRQYITCEDGPEVVFAWQGGEPTLLGIDYFESVMALQKKHSHGKKVTNTIQTNGTLLTDGWGKFLKKHNFLVGLSVDGPREIHDKYRVGMNGQGTFDNVMSALTILKKHGVSFNTLTVINNHNSRNPLKVYRFLKKIGDRHMQFIPAVERLPDDHAKELGLNLAAPPSKDRLTGNSTVTEWSVSPVQLAYFYKSIFDEWVLKDVGAVFVQFFDVALGNWLGAGSGLCQFAQTCGTACALEFNGDLYSCDHYVYPENKLGNIITTPLSKLMASKIQKEFGRAKFDNLPQYCQDCEVRPACNGDCPKHRFAKSPDGEVGVSYLCDGYKEIFTHMAPYLSMMAELYQKGRPVAEVMSVLRNHVNRKANSGTGRNAPCVCGSGKKYKRCCGRT